MYKVFRFNSKLFQNLSTDYSVISTQCSAIVQFKNEDWLSKLAASVKSTVISIDVDRISS